MSICNNPWRRHARMQYEQNKTNPSTKKYQLYQAAKVKEKTFEEFVVNATGECFRTGEKDSKGDFYIFHYSTMNELNKECSYQREQGRKSIPAFSAIQSNIAGYTRPKCGGVFITPPAFLLNLILCIRAPGDSAGTRLEEQQWNQIQRSKRENDNARKNGSAFYTMLHWDGDIEQGSGDGRWISHDTLLYPRTQQLVNSLARNILEKFCQPERFEDYVCYPGFVLTRKAYHQELHIDEDTSMDKNGQPILVVHVPLCLEGMNLRVHYLEDGIQRTSDSTGKKKFVEKIIHVPFGTGLVLPINLYHAGCYGDEGNLRFHMHIRGKNDRWTHDRIIRKTDATTALPRELKMIDGQNQKFTEYYIHLLNQNFGVVLDKTCFSNLQLTKLKKYKNRSIHERQTKNGKRMRPSEEISERDVEQQEACDSLVLLNKGLV